MADRRKSKKKKEAENKSEEDKPSKMEYDVAKFLKNQLPPKRTTLLGHKVDYFIASKAIDSLMDSKWAKKEKNQKEASFTSRDSVVDFLELMLRHKFFHRAKKIIVKDSSKKKKDHEEGSAPEDLKEKKRERREKEKEKEKAKETDKREKEKENEKEKEKEGKSKGKDHEKEKEKEEESEEKKVEKKKEKKKVKLDMHMEQIFVDGNEPFVWIYDPIPLKAWLIGAGLVFGAVAICLFPLWPRTVRNYVYYLSIAAAAFLFFIIALAVLRLIVFVLVWLVTFGHHHLWLLPNLTEDVGFFASFWPLYQYEYKGNADKEKDEEEEDKDPSEEREETKEVPAEKKGKIEEGETKDPEGSEGSSESENNCLAGNGGNIDNGFEILDSADLEDKKTI